MFSLTKRFGVVVTGAVSLLLMSACEQSVEPPPLVVVRPVKTMMLDDVDGMQRNFPATIEASRRVDMSFRVPGRLQELRVAEGDKVAAGQILATLDPTDYRLALNNAQAELDRARSDWERAKVLVAKGHLSRSDFDANESNYRRAAAAAEQARLDLSYTELKAPISGTIAKRYIENFEEVEAKQELFALRDNSELEVRVNIPESVVMRLPVVEEQMDDDDPGLWVSFSMDAQERFPLRIKEVATRADEATQTFEARLTFDAPEKLNVLPGMSALVSADLSTVYADKLAVKLPAGAIDTRTEQPRIWIYNPQTGTASPRDVTIGPIIGDSVELLSGADFGERIIVAGAEHLDESMPLYEMRDSEQASM